MRARIRAAFPDHGIVGEEFGERRTDREPCAGTSTPSTRTHNFMRGMPVFGTLLGIEVTRRAGRWACCSAPALGTRWHAWRGGGAWETKLSRHRGTGRAAPAACLGRVAGWRTRSSLYSSVPQPASTRAGARASAALIREAWRDRGFGDFWGYALVAEGAGGGDDRDRPARAGTWDRCACWWRRPAAG